MKLPILQKQIKVFVKIFRCILNIVWKQIDGMDASEANF